MNRIPGLSKAEFDKWNQILVESGHEEIEDFSRDQPQLKRHHGYDFRSMDPLAIQSKTVYYQVAQEKLRLYPFKNETDKLVWQLHTEGLSIREITRRINKKKYKQTQVFRKIKKISEKKFPYDTE